MLINCYYYAPHNHTLLAEYVRRDLDRMKELGTDIVSFCVQETQLDNWHWKRIDNFIALAHRAGLTVHAVPNRWAGLFAGWLDGFSAFTVKNHRLLIEDRDGRPLIGGEMACCVNKPEVRDYVAACLKRMLDRFAFDGVIWDEPHSYRCHCADCRAAGIASSAAAHRAFGAYLDELSRQAKSLRPGITASVFVQPQNDDLLEALLDTEHLDYIGSDGHLRSSDHRMHRMKGTIFEVHEKFAPKIRAAGKKTFFLIEGQRHRDEDLANYLEHLEAAFRLPMDQLMYYYSAHEMSPENERIFNHATWEAVKKAKAAAPIPA